MWWSAFHFPRCGGCSACSTCVIRSLSEGTRFTHTVGGHAVPLAVRDAGTTHDHHTERRAARSDYNDDDKLHACTSWKHRGGKLYAHTHRWSTVFCIVLVVVYCGHRCEDWQHGRKEGRDWTSFLAKVKGSRVGVWRSVAGRVSFRPGHAFRASCGEVNVTATCMNVIWTFEWPAICAPSHSRSNC